MAIARLPYAPMRGAVPPMPRGACLTSLLACAVLQATAFLSIGAAQAPLPAACADSVRQALGSMVGEWQVRQAFRAGRTSWDSSRSRSRIVRELHGCLLLERVTGGTRAGRPFTVLNLIGAHGLTAPGRIQLTSSHSQHGLLSHFDGQRTGDSVVLESRVEFEGRRIVERIVYTLGAADRFTVLNLRLLDDGTTWLVTAREEYVRTAPRRSASAPPLRRQQNPAVPPAP